MFCRVSLRFPCAPGAWRLAPGAWMLKFDVRLTLIQDQRRTAIIPAIMLAMFRQRPAINSGNVPKIRQIMSIC